MMLPRGKESRWESAAQQVVDRCSCFCRGSMLLSRNADRHVEDYFPQNSQEVEMFRTAFHFQTVCKLLEL